jgi:hypothetical protein
MGNRVVEIVFRENHASVVEGDRPLIEPVVSAVRPTFREVNGVVVGLAERHTFGRAEAGPYVFPAKLIPVVAAHLEACGIRVTIQRPLVAGVPAADVAALAAATPAFRSLFATAGGAYGGIFRCGDDERDALIPTILKLYPRCRIVLATKNRDQQAGWLFRLRGARIPQPVVDHQQLIRGWGRQPLVLVTSFSKLDYCTSDCFDVAIVPDVGPLRGAELGPPVWQGPAAHYPRDYRLLRTATVPAFGFAQPGLDLTPIDELRLLAMFARWLPWPAAPRPALRVVTEVLPRHVGVGGAATPNGEPARRREWANRSRNRFIDELARVIAAGQAELLRPFGLRHSPGVPSAGRVVLLVAASEHADALAEELPGWAVVTGHPAAAVPPPTDEPVVILTEAAAATPRGATPDILIDARDGGPLEDSLIRSLAGPGGRPLVLIDVCKPGPRARRRLQAYVRGGTTWTPRAGGSRQEKCEWACGRDGECCGESACIFRRSVTVTTQLAS